MIEPGTQYVVSVRAFNDVDKGPVIYDLVYTASSQGALSRLVVGGVAQWLERRSWPANFALNLQLMGDH